MIAGLSMHERITGAAKRAGAASHDANGRPNGITRLVLVPANIVPQVSWLRALVHMPVEPERLYVDASGAAVIETGNASDVLGIAARARTADDALRSLSRRHETADARVDSAGRLVIETPRDVPVAERWLLRGLIKQDEGFMSRHFERRVSLALTRRLASTRLTPNAMTLVSVGVGLLAAPFFLFAHPLLQLAGALLFLAHSILDGCDGELARLKFMESRSGAVLDFWGDNLVHGAVFAAMGVGWALRAGTLWPLLAGAAAVASSMASATVLAPQFVTGAGPARGRTLASRLAAALSHRDFIYLVVLLSAFGKAHWFLALTAVGAPSYFLMVWRLRRRAE